MEYLHPKEKVTQLIQILLLMSGKSKEIRSIVAMVILEIILERLFLM